MDAQEVFKSTLINEDYSISSDIDRYHGCLRARVIKSRFFSGYMHLYASKYLNLNIGKTVGYNIKILVSSRDMKIGSNRDIDKDHQKLSRPEPGKAESAAPKTVKNIDKPIKDLLAAQHDPVGNKTHQVQQTDNQRMLAEWHNDEKLAITILIVGAGLVVYHFWKVSTSLGLHVQCVTFVIPSCEMKWHPCYSQSLAESLALSLIQQRLVALIFYLIGIQIMVKKNAKDMIWHLKSLRGLGTNGMKIE